MYSSSGGSHVLLFERDQQLAAQLTNELQLVGLECHTARTAVEVFDAIARYPVRLVLVNLAQAAAARREFWVALDTQRRGRGVQVFTFHCQNIAGYGPATTDDTDEPSQTVLADMDIDGMSGLTNMVNTIRARITASNTGNLARTTSNSNPQVISESPVTNTATMPMFAAPPDITATNATYEKGTAPSHPAASQTMQPFMRISTPTPAPIPPQSSRMSTHNPTDKMHAVIYPHQRNWPSRESGGSNSQLAGYREQQTQVAGSTPLRNGVSLSSPVPSPVPVQMTREIADEKETGNSEMAFPNESGLAQLSRMLQERDASPNSGSALLEELARGKYDNERMDGEQGEVYMPQTSNTPKALQGQHIRPGVEPLSLSSIELRVSPIEELPSERSSMGFSEREISLFPNMTNQRYEGATSQTGYGQAAASTLVSISTPPSQAVPQTSNVTPVTPGQGSYSEEDTLTYATAQPGHAREAAKDAPAPVSIKVEETAQQKDSLPRNNSNEVKLVEQIQAMVASGSTRAAAKEAPGAGTDNALLLDIVQSLPPMPSPPPQQQGLNGRATRSLSNVLLEGHLVPQDRLEVAQNIQRMLRGVDMNYQLGEILLMFKLLTPDQLLAASLVSYGMISAMQIRSLGRIRQELYSIGLEYDLENLLILFRILTSEQLREVRASWSS
jgi:hypothetical protein